MSDQLAEWQSVPDRVAALFKEAAPVARVIRRMTTILIAAPGSGEIYFHPKKRELHAVLSDIDDEDKKKQWEEALEALKDIDGVQVSEEPPENKEAEWVLVKRANAPLGIIGKPFEWGGALTGGPSPLSNAIVGALLTGGLGYGTGWLLEHLFPERFVARGRLRKTLGALGALGGTAIPAWQWRQNALTAREAGKPLGVLGSLITPTDKVPFNEPGARRVDLDAFISGPEGGRYDPGTATYLGNKETRALQEKLGESVGGLSRFARAAEQLLKIGQELSAGGVGLRAVPMDAFNQAIWNDVRMGLTASRNPYGTKSPWGYNEQAMHTPPSLGAATAGLATGIQQLYGNQSVLSPQHFIRGLATAGVDLVTSRVVGGTLGALGGLTPVAQKKLQDIGMWGGLIRGTVGSMLGLR